MKENAPTLDRTKVVAFIRNQFTSGPERLPKPNTHHYGKQELRELLDFIYGGPPKTDDEKL